jgi:hypothetical protein
MKGYEMEQHREMAKRFTNKHDRGTVECTWNEGNQLFHVYYMVSFKMPTGDGGWYFENEVSSFSQMTFDEMVRELE